MIRTKPNQAIPILFLSALLSSLSTACQTEPTAIGNAPEAPPLAATPELTAPGDQTAEQQPQVTETAPSPFGTAPPAPGVPGTVVGYENWDFSMKDAWEGPIASGFALRRPDIELAYLVTSAAEYDEKLVERFEKGSATDLIACRAFSPSAELYAAGYLSSLDEIDNGTLSDSAFEAWTAPDGTRYCVPISSVMEGFIYNADIFADLGLEPPTTLAAFHDTLETIAEDGRYVPLAIGLADPWRIGELGINIMGPTFWEGEAGRQRILHGDVEFTDPPFVDLLAEIASWRPYLPEEAEFVDGAGATDLFTTGQAAIYPAGSWYIADLLEVDFPVGAFAPPRRDASGRCYVLDQPDLGIALNASSPHQQEGKAFLQWLTTQDFADTAASAFVGRFPMADTAPESPIPVAAAFDEWRSTCVSSMRLRTNIPTSPDFTDRDVWDLIVDVVSGEVSPQRTAELFQQGYGPRLEIVNS